MANGLIRRQPQRSAKLLGGLDLYIHGRKKSPIEGGQTNFRKDRLRQLINVNLAGLESHHGIAFLYAVLLRIRKDGSGRKLIINFFNFDRSEHLTSPDNLKLLADRQAVVLAHVHYDKIILAIDDYDLAIRA